MNLYRTSFFTGALFFSVLSAHSQLNSLVSNQEQLEESPVLEDNSDTKNLIEQLDTINQLDDLPSTFDITSLLNFDGGFRSNDSQGLAYALRFTQSYNSNLNLTETQSEGTHTFSVSPTLSYRSAGVGRARFIYGVSYQPTFSFRRGGREGNDEDHQLDTTLSWEGAKTNIALRASYSLQNQSDRSVNSFTENTNYGLSLRADYKVSEKTSFLADFSYRESENSSSRLSETSGLSLTTSALWQVTPLLKIGPSLRYATSDSDSLAGISSLAILARFDYDLSAKINASLSLGVERTELDQSSSDSSISPSGDLNVSYALDSIWSLSLQASVQALSVENLQSRQFTFVNEDSINNPNISTSGDNEPQLSGSAWLRYNPGNEWSAQLGVSLRDVPSSLNGNEISKEFTWQIGASRTLGVGQASLNYSRSTSEFDSLSGESARGDETFESISLSYVHPTFYYNTVLTLSLLYGQNSGFRDFDQNSASISINRRF